MANENLKSEWRGLRDRFSPWLSATSVDEARFFSSADTVIALDANVLLELYRISSGTRNEMLALLSAVKERIWIPHQAAEEYARNRAAAIRDGGINAKNVKTKINGRADKAKSAIEGVVDDISSFRKKHRATVDWDSESLNAEIVELIQLLGDFWKGAKGEVDRVKDEIEISSEDPEKDAILKELDELLRGRIGDPFDTFELQRHVDHAVSFRFPNKIPPGYADENKENGLKKAGDYILWRQLLDHMNSLESNGEKLLILVTNDFKLDWREAGSEGESFRPAPELILEMRNEADSDLLMISSSYFLKRASEHLNREISSEAVKELKEEEAAAIGAAVLDRFFKESELRVGVSSQFRDAMEQAGNIGISSQFRDAMEQAGNIGISSQFRDAMEQAGNIGISSQFRDAMEQAGNAAVSPQFRDAMAQVGKAAVSPELLAVMQNPAWMRAVRDAQGFFDSEPDLADVESDNDEDKDS